MHILKMLSLHLFFFTGNMFSSNLLHLQHGFICFSLYSLSLKEICVQHQFDDGANFYSGYY